MIRINLLHGVDLTPRRRPLPPVNGAAANGLLIRCCVCGRATRYGTAVEEGWAFDPNGTPFEAYYCAKDGAR